MFVILRYILFSETSQSGMNITSVIQQINNEFDDKIDEIKSSGSFDGVEVIAVALIGKMYYLFMQLRLLQMKTTLWKLQLLTKPKSRFYHQSFGI